MRDPEFEELVSRRPKRAGHGRRLTKRVGLAIVGMWGLSVLGLQGCSRMPYICAVCREDRINHRVFVLTWSDYQETDCSLWYRDNVEPAHAHCWAPCSHCQRFGIPGLYGGFACTIGGPITGLSRTVQIEIYQHFEDPLEAKQLFIRMGQGDYRKWDALMAWVDAGYPGTWNDWLGKRGPTEEATP